MGKTCFPDESEHLRTLRALGVETLIYSDQERVPRTENRVKARFDILRAEAFSIYTSRWND